MKNADQRWRTIVQILYVLYQRDETGDADEKIDDGLKKVNVDFVINPRTHPDTQEDGADAVDLAAVRGAEGAEDHLVPFFYIRGQILIVEENGLGGAAAYGCRRVCDWGCRLTWR